MRLPTSAVIGHISIYLFSDFKYNCVCFRFRLMIAIMIIIIIIFSLAVFVKDV